ncbi:uncharacterized protein LAESUDRAFT_722014 [Laetiporus sulphureus 93-53]|uniref:PQ-loop-domain-containing protein n=1 Tax=Laetiporus sulphureus 93-53 TaxID=1314785 RepID=A0A165G5R9_9APHY|nr:uncharacterized protein LAESUDRAFT_722014 [Laetiporus sulphureus 93-53]KZT09864.1 hypothetical protein LAESUDRAFT_722014 [Laetiporus sulphureus 93-53]
MPYNPAAENALGTLGTICWTLQLVPQIWKSWRAKSTEGLSEILVFLWGVSGVPMGVYAIVQNLNIPLILQPQLFGILCFAAWAQCQYYGHKRSLSACIIMYITCLVALAGFQVGMVYAVRPSYERGNDGGVEFFGILSSVLIAIALLPQYWEIYRRREVVGISVPFMTIDMLGGVFNDLSLAFKSEFNVIAGVTYSLVVVMDGVVILLALILNPLARRRRKRAALAECSEVPPLAQEQSSDAQDADSTADEREAGSSTPKQPVKLEDIQHTTIDCAEMREIMQVDRC